MVSPWAVLAAAGDRPPPVPLRPDLDRLADVGGDPLPPGDAAGVARRILGPTPDQAGR